MEFLPEPDILLDPPELPEIPLPKGWSEYTLLAVLHVIALARIIRTKCRKLAERPGMRWTTASCRKRSAQS